MGRRKCGRARCFPCLGSKGGNCWREEVTYSLWCEECGEKVAAYQGETGRNGFTRGREHLENLEAKNEDGFFGIFGPPYFGIGATIRIGQEMLCFPYAGF